ncbi:IS3 family transposase, partial [Streptomyces olivoreticuli]
MTDTETAVAEYIDRFNQRRLHGELNHLTPAEHEAAHYLMTEPPASLQKTSYCSIPQRRYSKRRRRWRVGGAGRPQIQGLARA